MNKAFLFVALLIVVGGVVAQIISTKADDVPLTLKTETVRAESYSAENMPINLVFRNTGDKTVRLLDVFSDSNANRVFFTIRIIDVNGTPVATIGGGKISLSKSSIKYIELEKGETLSVGLDVTDFLPSEYSLKPGVYSISVAYYNQYGENCFKGKIESRAITVNVPE